MAQLSFYSAEANPPARGDLAGLLCGPGRLVSFGGVTARLSIPVPDAWRARELERALAAVIIVIGAIVISKRRAHSMGEEEPASVESDTAAAIQDAMPEPSAEDAAVGAAHGGEGQSANGHQPSGKPAGTQKSDADPGE